MSARTADQEVGEKSLADKLRGCAAFLAASHRETPFCDLDEHEAAAIERNLLTAANAYDADRALIAALVSALRKAQQAAHWHNWNDPQEYRDRASLEAQASDMIDAALSSVERSEPRFPLVYCSQCGNVFGPGNHGYSACSEHSHEGKP